MSGSVPYSQISSVSDIYLWLSNIKAPLSIDTDQDLTAQTVSFLKAQGIRPNTMAIEMNKKAVKKAYSAFSFIHVAQTLRKDPRLRGISDEGLRDRVSTNFAKSRISQVFDGKVRRDREVIIPSDDDIELFSSEWDSLPIRSSSRDVGLALARGIIDDRLGSMSFPTIYQLSQLRNDPRLSQIPSEGLMEFIAKEYPCILTSKLMQENHRIKEILPKIDSTEVISVLLDSFQSKEAVRRAVIDLDQILKTSVEDPEFFLQASEQFKPESVLMACQNRESINKVFKGFSSRDLEAAYEGALSFRDKIIVLGMRLSGISQFSQLDELNRSKMSPIQRQIWDNRNRVISSATDLTYDFVVQLMSEERVLEVPHVNESIQPSIARRNGEHITRQFEKDGHRYGRLILTDIDNRSTDIPGKNTAEIAKPFLLEQLRSFATSDIGFDPHLFATLQESVCQNLEKLSTSLALLHELREIFGEKGVEGLLMISFRKECLGLKKIGNPSRFLATHEYNLTIVNPNNGAQSNLAIRYEYPIIRSKRQWAIGQPKRTCLSGAVPRLYQIGNLTPLPSIPQPTTSANKPHPTESHKSMPLAPIVEDSKRAEEP